MESINSFKGYGKVDELEQEAFRKKTRKRLIILIISSVILVALIIGAVAGTVIHNRNNSSSSSSSGDSAPHTELTPAASLKAVCDATRYPDSCRTSIASHLSYSNTTTDPESLFKLSLLVAIDEVSKLATTYRSELRANAKDPREQRAIDVCGIVLDDAVDSLNESISSLEAAGGGKKTILSPAEISDLKTWLSATISNQETCLDAVEELNSTNSKAILRDLRIAMRNSTEFTSNSLAIVTKIIGVLANFNLPIHRRLLGSGSHIPDWVGLAERRLLQLETNKTTPDVVVAKDGTGQYKTISEAVAAVKKKSESRFVIYVKEGVYVENVELDKNTWNVMMIGDGKSKTIISGSRNYIDGTPTFETATFAVKGRGFIAKDIGFKNTAGASKHQAVALRSASDRSVFYKCSFDGYQDTLYAHSNRQFYRECDITGTIDFIFGYAASIFQNCYIKPRQPLPNQFNTITAQGKSEPNLNSGIIIQNSVISALDDLTAPTYLGRPWKNYSTTVFMHSDIAGFLSPLGWTEWYPNVEPPSSIFYAEYQNTGAGSSVAQRVKWAGYKPSLSEDEAGRFTVQSFIQGTEWLPQTDVEFQSTL
ncbi:Pectinesterase 3 [Senna tora]|uniref:Pectinesterase n=1 Tax=Senna tora TaxID=362788 RepID=A0A834WCC6_9FABA|nr:Pectinesterase 3 [Senna tora]